MCPTLSCGVQRQRTIAEDCLQLFIIIIMIMMAIIYYYHDDDDDDDDDDVA